MDIMEELNMVDNQKILFDIVMSRSVFIFNVIFSTLTIYFWSGYMHKLIIQFSHRK